MQTSEAAVDETWRRKRSCDTKDGLLARDHVMPRLFSTELQFQKRFEDSCVGSNDILFGSSMAALLLLSITMA